MEHGVRVPACARPRSYTPQGLANTAAAWANLGLLSRRYAQLALARADPREFSSQVGAFACLRSCVCMHVRAPVRPSRPCGHARASMRPPFRSLLLTDANKQAIHTPPPPFLFSPLRAGAVPAAARAGHLGPPARRGLAARLLHAAGGAAAHAHAPGAVRVAVGAGKAGGGPGWVVGGGEGNCSIDVDDDDDDGAGHMVMMMVLALTGAPLCPQG